MGSPAEQGLVGLTQTMRPQRRYCVIWVVVAVGVAQVVEDTGVGAEILWVGHVSIEYLGVQFVSCFQDARRAWKGDGCCFFGLYSRLGGCQSSGNASEKLHLGAGS